MTWKTVPAGLATFLLLGAAVSASPLTGKQHAAAPLAAALPTGPGTQEQVSATTEPAGPATSAAEMAVAARELIEGMGAQLAGYGTTAFDDPVRLQWDYRPVSRVGVPLFELDAASTERLWTLLQTALGDVGVAKVKAIIELQRAEFEKSRDPGLDPRWYFFAFFGVPREEGPWGWRFEGNHVSVNVTVLDGVVVSVTPTFLGARPRFAEASRVAAERAPLAPEETAAAALLNSLDEAQTRRAIFAAQPPDDILSSNDSRALRPTRLGIRFADLSPEQQALMRALVEAHAARFAPGLAAAQLAAIDTAGWDEVRFGWAGAPQAGAAAYHRVHGLDFVIEYGVADGDATHVHSTWRNFDNDFGRRSVRHATAAQSATLTPITPGVEDAQTQVAATEARRKLELLGADVPDNGCHATATVLDRRPLDDDDPLPRTFQRVAGLEVISLKITASTPAGDGENLCGVGDTIDVVSPRYPVPQLVGKQIFLDLELSTDGRVSAWRASRIRTSQ